MDVREYARYPFVRGASDFARRSKVELEDLLSHSAFLQARMRGKKRVLDAIEKANIDDNSMVTEEDRLLEVLSYPMARILVSCVGDGFLIRRYALAEAKTAYDRMQTEKVETLMEIAEELGVEASLVDDVPNMHFADFLRFTSGLRSKEWKLVNTEVKKGMVSLPKVKFARVLEQALHDKIEDELPLPVTRSMLEALKSDISELKMLAEQMKDRYQVEGFGEVDVECFPPCMKRLVAMAQSGENISHPGRFALTSFLFNIGLSREEILKIFAGSPDFDEAKTRYQIDHITGEISGTTYTPPECSTMKTNAVCFNPDNLCKLEWVKHPLIYYRAKTRSKRRSASTAQPVKGTAIVEEDKDASKLMTPKGLDPSNSF